MAAGANDYDIKMARAKLRIELTHGMTFVMSNGRDKPSKTTEITPTGIGGCGVIHTPHPEVVEDRSVLQSRISNKVVNSRWGDLDMVLKRVDSQRILWENLHGGTLVNK